MAAGGEISAYGMFAIRLERALCREVRVNIAYRWFCGLRHKATEDRTSALGRMRVRRFQWTHGSVRVASV